MDTENVIAPGTWYTRVCFFRYLIRMKYAYLENGMNFVKLRRSCCIVLNIHTCM